MSAGILGSSIIEAPLVLITTTGRLDDVKSGVIPDKSGSTNQEGVGLKITEASRMANERYALDDISDDV